MCDHSLPRRRYYFHLKDPGSAITHFFGLVGAVLVMPALLIHGAWEGYSPLQMAALSVFLLSMVGLYAASTAYHSFDLEHGRNRILKKLDHIMIFFLIAGTYTPICLITLPDKGGVPLLAGVWAVALSGLVLKLCWVYHPKWLSSVLYIELSRFARLAAMEITPPTTPPNSRAQPVLVCRYSLWRYSHCSTAQTLMLSCLGSFAAGSLSLRLNTQTESFHDSWFVCFASLQAPLLRNSALSSPLEPSQNE